MYAVCYVLKSGVEKWINPTYKDTWIYNITSPNKCIPKQTTSKNGIR